MLLLKLLMDSFGMGLSDLQLKLFFEFLEETEQLMKLFEFEDMFQLEEYLMDNYIWFQENKINTKTCNLYI